VFTYARITTPGTRPGASEFTAVVPENAGEYAVKVRFENSRWVIERDLTRLNIRRKSLAAAGVQIIRPLADTHIYDGRRQEPEFRVVDNDRSAATLDLGVHFEAGTGDRVGNTLVKSPIGTAESGRLGVYANNVDAGTAFIHIRGIDNYIDDAFVSFPIAQRPIVVTADAITISAKTYDGTPNLTSSLIGNVAWTTSLNWDVSGWCNLGATAWTVTGTYNDARATEGTTNTARINNGIIGLNYSTTTDVCANNFVLEGTSNNRLPFTKTDLVINKAVPVAANFTNDVQDLLYTGIERRFNVNWLAPLSNGANNPLAIRYVGIGNAWNSATPPTEKGTYRVDVIVDDNNGTPANFRNGTVEIKSFIIGDKRPAFWVRQPTDTIVRQGEGTVTLSAEVVKPLDNNGNRITTGPPLAYQWFRDGVSISGATGATYTWSAPIYREEAYEFSLRVIYTNATFPNAQEPDTTWNISGGNVIVRRPAESIATARVRLHEGYDLEYNGYPHVPTFDVVMGNPSLGEEITLVNGRDYTFNYLYNIDAGTGIIRITGLRAQIEYERAYFGTVDGSFLIARRKLERYDVLIANDGETEYNRGPQAPTFVGGIFDAGATPASRFDGIGNATNITYTNSANVTTSTAPTDSGVYTVKARFAQGRNFFASEDEFEFTYKIVPRVFDLTDVDVSGINVDISITLEEGQTALADTNLTRVDISDVVMLGTKFGENEILYADINMGNVDSRIPPTRPGTYHILVGITGGDNYHNGVIRIGTITISPWTSVKDVGGVVGGETEISVIKPVTPLSAVFTAGPNPVSKNAGSVAFFWQGKAINSSNLSVFTATGALVAKVNVSDLGTSTARREVGSWNLRDTKGNQVSEGTYLIRGVVTGKDGSKERVSYKVNVR